MKLIVKGTGVGYGISAADAAITDLANISTLKPGSFLFSHDNGNVVKVDGTIQANSTVPAEKGIIWYNDGGDIKAGTPITLATAKLLRPYKDTAAAAKVVTVDLTFPTVTVDKYSGIYLLDNKKPMFDKSGEFFCDALLGAGVTQAAFNAAVLAKLQKVYFVETAAVDGNDVFTITFKAGYNPVVKGMGYFDQNVVTVSNALANADSMSGAELKTFADQVLAPHDGRRENYIDGNIGLWAKTYGVDLTKRYVVYAITWQAVANGRPYQNSPSMENIVYIAIVEGELAAATNEGYMDIFNAFLSGTGSDTGAAGADAADN